MFKIYRYLDDENNRDSLEGETELDDFGEDDFDSELDREDGAFDDSGGEQEEGAAPEDSEPEDPDFQGVIRTVPGACLVYKRRDQKNSFEELWVYNVGGRDIKPEMRIRNSVLAGTDIDPKTQRSPDGQQTCDTLSVGNVQFLHIKGLVN